MNAILKIILLPFSLLYNGVTAIRNKLYDYKIFKSTQFDIPVIGVGNLTVGGTGKTPMVEYLIRVLKEKNNIGTISRGYGRKTRGFRIAGDDDTAVTIGDEPHQLYTKFKDEVVVTVGEERILAVPQLLYAHPETQVIILDDAFQHRSIRPSFQILLTDYSNPFFNDVLMPAGRLRESRGGARRADIVMVTKCPAKIPAEKKEIYLIEIAKYTGGTPVFFSTLSYGSPIQISGIKKDNFKDVVLVSGIANPTPLMEKIKQEYNLLKHFRYNDHYNYTKGDIEKICSYINTNSPNAIVITTEKDAVKLKPLFNDITIPLITLPVGIKIIDKEDIFLEMVSKASYYTED